VVITQCKWRMDQSILYNIETTKLGKKGKKVVPITEIQEFPIPEIDQNIEDYELSMESGKIEAVKK
jgi:hypothetical protein